MRATPTGSTDPPTATAPIPRPATAPARIAATPTVVATKRPRTSIVQVTGPLRVISTRPWARSATQPEACVITYAAITGVTSSPM